MSTITRPAWTRHYSPLISSHSIYPIYSHRSRELMLIEHGRLLWIFVSFLRLIIDNIQEVRQVLEVLEAHETFASRYSL